MLSYRLQSMVTELFFSFLFFSGAYRTNIDNENYDRCKGAVQTLRSVSFIILCTCLEIEKRRAYEIHRLQSIFFQGGNPLVKPHSFFIIGQPLF